MVSLSSGSDRKKKNWLLNPEDESTTCLRNVRNSQSARRNILECLNFQQHRWHNPKSRVNCTDMSIVLSVYSIQLSLFCTSRWYRHSLNVSVFGCPDSPDSVERASVLLPKNFHLDFFLSAFILYRLEYKAVISIWFFTFLTIFY